MGGRGLVAAGSKADRDLANLFFANGESSLPLGTLPENAIGDARLIHTSDRRPAARLRCIGIVLM
jgi:hypothetical protein